MISIWNLIWIIPLSAVAGVVFAVGIIIFDDCLWWASDKAKREEMENVITREELEEFIEDMIGGEKT